jgi:hypothetical protein
MLLTEDAEEDDGDSDGEASAIVAPFDRDRDDCDAALNDSDSEEEETWQLLPGQPAHDDSAAADAEKGKAYTGASVLPLCASHITRPPPCPGRLVAAERLRARIGAQTAARRGAGTRCFRLRSR